MNIGKKFTLAVIASLLVVIITSLLIFASFELRQEKKKLPLFSRMTGQIIEESLDAYMLTRNSTMLDAKLAEIKKNVKIIANIWVLNQHSIVKNGSDQGARGRKWPEISTSAEIAADGRQGVLLEDGTTYRWMQYVTNKTECHRCHRPQAKYNGIIIIDFSLHDVIQNLRKEIYGATAIILISLLLTGGAVLALWNILVRRRLIAVVDKIRLFKEGVYRCGPARQGKDEFVRFENDIDAMAAAVQGREVEKQNLVRQLSLANEELQREIGMRKQWDVQLQEQKFFSDSLIQNSAVATFVLGFDHRVIIWNKACEELTGVQAASMLGTSSQWKPFYRNPRQTLADLVLDGTTGDLAGRYEKYSRSTLVQNGLHAEGWYEGLNGRDRYIIFDAAPIHHSNGSLIAVIETLQDVTEQKNAEALLAGSEAKLRTIIETEPECVKLVSVDGTILEINKAGLDMIEAERPEQAMGASIFQLVVPEHHPALREHLERAIKEGPDTVEFEIVGLRGTRRWFETRAALLPNPGGESHALLAVTRDVTERKQWEKKLQDQLQFLQTLMETIPMPVFYKDARGVYQGCNRAFEQFMGFSKEQVVGKTVYDVASKDLADIYYQKDRELFENPGIQVYENQIKHADGSLRHVTFSKATYRDAKGSVAGLLGVMQDITERKKAEAALRESETQFRELAGLLPQPVYEADLQGRIIFGNKSAFDYFGYRLEDLGQMSLADMIIPEDRQRAQHHLEQLARGAKPSGKEYTAVSKEGNLFPVMVYSAPVNREGRVVGFRGIIMDITERKKAEEALRQAYHTLETLISASPLAILTLDSEGKITLWNAAAERIFGWTAQEAMGRINPIIPADRLEEFKQLRSRVMNGESVMGLEIQRMTKAGVLIDLSLSTAPLRDAAGQVTAIMAVLDDITERKRAEAAIKRHYDTQTAINWILHISLENIPLENILKQTLDLILSIPWLSFESRGGIFLVEEDRPEVLVLKAERGLSENIRNECSTVQFGKCLCGRAAARGEAQFSDSIDARHEIHYDGMNSHGHYCVPIKHTRTVIGVLNIYLKEGHIRDDREIEFLNAIANALAGVIRRSKAEAALQESEKRYRTLAEAAHDIIFIADREGRIRFMNSYGADLFGLKVSELKGQNIEILFRPELSSAERMNFSSVLQTGQSLYTENAFSFLKQETWFGTWLVPLTDEEGRVDSVLGVARDITGRKRSEREREKLILDLQKALNMISRSQKEWQDTFDSITDMIAIIDKDFRIVKANRAFAGYFGFHPKEIIQRKCYEFCHKTEGPIPGCLHQRSLAERQPLSEELLDKKTGRTFLMTTFPYLSPEGDVIGSIHVSRDVTDERDRESRLIMSERLAALGQMASGIAHEINNPLASIAGCSEGLLSRIKKGQCDYKLFETYLNIIQEEIFRCKSITTAMLSFVRKTTYEKKEVNLAAMLDRTVEIISFQGRLKGIKIDRIYGDQVPAVQANEGELRQVFLAVMTNALDAMEDQGTLTLEAGVSGPHAFVRIADTGPGIPSEDINRIFDPFYTTKAERGGTGLGLSIARKIIHNHNGTIDVRSEGGQGTSFTILLPL